MSGFGLWVYELASLDCCTMGEGAAFGGNVVPNFRSDKDEKVSHLLDTSRD